MNSNIIEYIRVKFPYIIANGDFFCIVKNNKIIGFCNCKVNQKIISLTKPITLSKNKNVPIMKFFYKTVEKLPMVKTTNIKEKNIKNSLKKLLKNKDIYTYNAFYDNETDDFIFIENKYEKYINDIKNKMESDQKMIEICKKEIMYNIENLLQNIQKYKKNVIDYFSSIEDHNMKITKKFYQKNNKNCDFLIQHLNNFIDISQIKEKDSNNLLDNSIILKKELEDLKMFFNKENLYIILSNGYKNRCKKYILKNKDDIIKSLKEYYIKWFELHNNLNDEKEIYTCKKDTIKNTSFIQNLLKGIIEKNNDVLNKYISLIDSQLKYLLNNQLTNLSFKEEILQSKTETNSSSNELFQNIDKSKKNLKYRLNKIKELLYLNNQTLVNIKHSNHSENSDVNDKNSQIKGLVYNFITLNNIFFRKQRVVEELNDIIQNENVLIEDYNLNIFEKIKNDIHKHVAFLNLQEIIDSPFLKFYKIKSTRNRIPKSFYNNIINILDFWNYNILYYLNQDLFLANIIDDLTKDIKVYVRVKPLVGIKDKTLLVSIKSNGNSISLNEKTYNGFENIYPNDFTNLDIYIGKQDFENDYSLDNINFLEKFKTVPNGFYNAFDKLQMGYSIVLFGTGISGSGTSYTLFGEKGIPGIVQYGLANLKNVSCIKLKHLFEQYVCSTNDTSIKGNLHNLINIVPQLNEYFSIDETMDFSEIIPSYINIKSLNIKDFDDLIEIIQTHRTKMNRIKYLPDGKSSRSNLYYIFEISFDNGDKSFLTVIDSCSQDTPNDVYNSFIDSKYMKLENFIICNKDEGINFVKKYVKNNIKENYKPEFIYECLQESIYNNETFNHFHHFINSKNNYY